LQRNASIVQDWAGTKAAYRFFSNDRVSEEEILRGHFDAATRLRLARGPHMPLILLHWIGPALGYGKRRTEDGEEALQA